MIKKNTVISVSLAFMLLSTSAFIQVNKFKKAGQSLDNRSLKIEEKRLQQDSESMFIDISSNSESLKDKIVRFHVIANSDEKVDQNVKLKIRDAILEKLGPEMESCKTKEESMKYLRKHLVDIEQIADQLLEENDFSYKSKAFVNEFNFPIKKYGEITLPQGKYTALRVVLGNGEGKNWWCIMFPPLCFVDITRAQTSQGSQNKLINSTTNKSKKLKTKVKYKFKAYEIVKKWF